VPRTGAGYTAGHDFAAIGGEVLQDSDFSIVDGRAFVRAKATDLAPHPATHRKFVITNHFAFGFASLKWSRHIVRLALLDYPS
jgi:hypothetical protein